MKTSIHDVHRIEITRKKYDTFNAIEIEVIGGEGNNSITLFSYDENDPIRIESMPDRDFRLSARIFREVKL